MHTATPSSTSRVAATAEGALWQAVIDRDASADGRFYYSVRTTGVYCRPSCPSRPARRENVAFHASCADAERAGFRACKRCRPTEPARHERDAALVARACRLLESAGEPVPLQVLARGAGLSAYHFHRLFKKVTGVTPRAYAQAQRGDRVRQALKHGASVTSAIYDAGYNSNGTFYAGAAQMLGMTPSSFRKGAADQEIGYAFGTSSLGDVLVAATAKGVCCISISSDRSELLDELKARFPRAQLKAAEPAFSSTVDAVVRLVETPAAGLSLPLDVRGTAFQQRVWKALCKVPAGRTVTYGELAVAAGCPSAVRAVASACANNPIAVAIPCHRVVHRDGSRSRYRWGTERKRVLQEREA